MAGHATPPSRIDNGAFGFGAATLNKPPLRLGVEQGWRRLSGVLTGFVSYFAEYCMRL